MAMAASSSSYRKKKKNSYQVMNLASSPERRKYEAKFLNSYWFVAPFELY